MSNHLKNYFFSTLAIRSIGIITIPITTRFLLPEDIGNITLFTSYSSIALVILTINSYSSISRYYFEKDNDLASFVSTSFYLSIISTIIISIIIIILSKLKLLNIEISDNLIYVIIINTVLNILSSIFIQINESQNNSSIIAKRTIFSGILQFTLSVLTIIFAPSPKWVYVIIATLLSSIITSIYFFKFIKVYITRSFKTIHLKYILSYSIPLIPYSLGSVILSQVDRIMVSKYAGINNTGIFSIAANMAMLITIFSDSINKSWMPKYFHLMNEGNYIEHDKGVKLNLDKWTFFSIIFISTFFEPLTFLIGKNFINALPVIPIFVLSYFFYFAFTIYSRNIGYKKRNIYTTLIMLISGILNIIFSNFILINYNYRFVVFGNLLSYITLLFMGWFVSKYILKIHTTKLSFLKKYFLILFYHCLIFYIILYLELNHFFSIIIKYISCFIIIRIYFNDIYFQILNYFKHKLYELRSSWSW